MKFCSVVWDGEKFEVPEDLGKPREDQLASTPLDNLAELSGRTCYDSLGSGRKTSEYHSHIIDVGHGSVQEHSNLTFMLVDLSLMDRLLYSEYLLNRPGIFVQSSNGQLRITANIRAIREWFSLPALNRHAQLPSEWNLALGRTLQNLARTKAPLLMTGIPEHPEILKNCTIVKPELDEELWVSMFFTNVSRGLSHELVRHKYRTAVSQRSTRYVDENTSPWSWHPLFRAYYEDQKDPDASLFASDVEATAKTAYAHYVTALQAFLITKGADRFTARKQARGAARGLLGNALMTEMIFSASLDQWKWMIHLRASSHADAEIRIVFNEVYELLSEKFPNRFVGWTQKPCPDGIGYELIKP
jgi:thymidylate synthase ThyX